MFGWLTAASASGRGLFHLIREVEILVAGGGPAGLCAAAAAASLGAKVLLCERSDVPGGQLVKQTHKFFGSEKQAARAVQLGAVPQLPDARRVEGGCNCFRRVPIYRLGAARGLRRGCRGPGGGNCPAGVRVGCCLRRNGG